MSDSSLSLESLPAASPRHWPDPWLLLGALLGWGWCIIVGVLCGMSYLGAILLAGWLNRLVQGCVLHRWWKQSNLRTRGAFDDFRATLGPDAPGLRPRWVFREGFSAAGIRAELASPPIDCATANGQREWWRIVLLLFGSFLDNFRTGVLAILATFLLVGWGGLLMTFSWLYGWDNSFHKGHEVWSIGPVTGFSGLGLFVFAMLYVPMAQTHMAVTGDFRAFFDFRIVWRLIRARLTAYCCLACLFLGFGVVLELLKTAPGFFDHIPRYRDASDQGLLWALRQYYFACSAFLFVGLVVTRLTAGWIYSSALLKVLRSGRVSRATVHPRLVDWLDRLDLYPQAPPDRECPLVFVRAAREEANRLLVVLALLGLWLVFGIKVYVGEFFCYHPYVGFLNQPLVLVPCANYIPRQLEESAARE